MKRRVEETDAYHDDLSHASLAGAGLFWKEDPHPPQRKGDGDWCGGQNRTVLFFSRARVDETSMISASLDVHASFGRKEPKLKMNTGNTLVPL